MALQKKDPAISSTDISFEIGSPRNPDNSEYKNIKPLMGIVWVNFLMIQTLTFVWSPEFFPLTAFDHSLLCSFPALPFLALTKIKEYGMLWLNLFLDWNLLSQFEFYFPLFQIGIMNLRHLGKWESKWFEKGLNHKQLWTTTSSLNTRHFEFFFSGLKKQTI